MKETENVELEDLFIPKERFEILQALATEGKSTLTRLLDITKSSKERLQPHLEFFIKNGIIEEIKFEKTLNYLLNLEDHRAQSVKKLFNDWKK